MWVLRLSLRTLDRDIASIAATDAGAIMGSRYSGLKTSPGTRYMKMMKDDKTDAGTIPASHYSGLKTSSGGKDMKTVKDDKDDGGSNAIIMEALLFRQKYGHEAAMKRRKEMIDSMRKMYDSLLHPQDDEKSD